MNSHLACFIAISFPSNTPHSWLPTLHYLLTVCMSLGNNKKLLYAVNARQSEWTHLSIQWVLRLSTQTVVFWTVTLCRLGAAHPPLQRCLPLPSSGSAFPCIFLSILCHNSDTQNLEFQYLVACTACMTYILQGSRCGRVCNDTGVYKHFELLQRKGRLKYHNWRESIETGYISGFY